jgi:hypothetical protein
MSKLRSIGLVLLVVILAGSYFIPLHLQAQVGHGSRGGGGAAAGSNFEIDQNAQTGTTYTIIASDDTKIVTFSNADPVAVTLPQAGTVGFEDKMFFMVKNIGSGTVTITPTTSTIDSDVSLALTTGQSATIISDGTNYTSTGTFVVSEADTLDTVFDRGKTIDGANSLANAVRIGDGTTPTCLYTDATLGPQVRPCTDANTSTIIPTNFTWCLYNIESTECIETVDPDAASVKAVWTYNTSYRPLKSIWFGAGSLSTDGTQAAAPAEVTINSGPKIWTIITTDNDAATIYGSVKMPDSWDGGTVTFEHVYLQTAADTSALNGDIAAQCRGNGEAPSSTWGTEVAIDDAAVTGSNQNDFTTSAAVTPAGTCAAGDMLYFRYQLDATGTTTAVATLHHVGFKMEYSTTSRSD